MRIRLELVVEIDQAGKALAKVAGWKVIDHDESLGSAVSQVFAGLVPIQGVSPTTPLEGEQPRGSAREIAVARMHADRVGVTREDLELACRKHNAARVIEVLQWMSRQQPRNPAAMFWSVLAKG